MSVSSIQGSTHNDVADLEGSDESPILSIRDLHVSFATKRGVETVLHGASLDIPRGRTVGLVGESGCGKSTLLKAALGALAPNARVASGEVLYDGINLLRENRETLRKLRWRKISMIPQSALNALNPVLRISDQIVEAVQAHTQASDAQARRMAAEIVARVGIDPKRIDEYPHQFSGGMRQRAIIAMALILEPELVLADEPTTSLDVIVQDQIFRLVRELQRLLGFAMLLVTHDLALVIENCDRIAVMYAGAIVEEGLTSDVVAEPFHPYTLGLKNSMPMLGGDKEPISIPGSPPDPTVSHAGCRFAARCPFAIPICHSRPPTLAPVKAGHLAACHRSGDAHLLRMEAAKIETWAA